MSNKTVDTTNYTKMDALKDILFGQEMGGLEERLNLLEDKLTAQMTEQSEKIAALKVHFDEKIAKTTSQLQTETTQNKTEALAKIQELSRELNLKISTLTTDTADIATISKALSDLGTKLLKK